MGNYEGRFLWFSTSTLSVICNLEGGGPREEGDGTIHCQKVKIWPILAKIRGTMGIILIE